MFRGPCQGSNYLPEDGHVPQETSADQFTDCVANLTADNGLGFSDTDLTAKGKNHNDALHVSIECRGTTLSHVLVDTGSSLNVLPKNALDRLDCEGLELKPSNIVSGPLTVRRGWYMGFQSIADCFQRWCKFIYT